MRSLARPIRLLEEARDLSVGDADSDNMLIQGDNLEALKALLGTDQNAAIHLYTHERACPEARSARGRGVSNNARARQRPWISAVSARADSRAA